jgi:hypothetical protein
MHDASHVKSCRIDLSQFLGACRQGKDGGKRRRSDMDFHFDARRPALLPVSLANAFTTCPGASAAWRCFARPCWYACDGAPMTVRGGGFPTSPLAFMPIGRMGPPLRTFAADAHDCIVVGMSPPGPLLPNPGHRRALRRQTVLRLSVMSGIRGMTGHATDKPPSRSLSQLRH